MPFWQEYRAPRAEGSVFIKPSRPARRFSPYAYGASALALASVVFVTLSFFARGATVTVYPRTGEAFVESTFIISGDETPGMLTASSTMETKIVQEVLDATGTAQVEEKARGTIRIENAFGAESQKLIKNTRFATPEGLVFRIPEAVEVPGTKTAADGSRIPGVLDVEVIADRAGAQYNIGPTPFTIPGFAGTSRFEKITASSASPMIGGFSGVRAVVAPEARAKTEEKLRVDLMKMFTNLKEEANRPHTQSKDTLAGDRTQEPIVIYDLTSVTYAPIEEEASADGTKVTLTLSGSVPVIRIKAEAFADYLASQTLASYDHLPLRLLNPEDLVITSKPFSDDLKKELPWEGYTIHLSVSGTAKFEWLFDTQAFTKDLAGKEEDAFPAILRSYPGISRAEVSIRPFWSSTLPSEVSKITIKEKLDFESDAR